MRFKINLPPETQVQETNTTIDTIKQSSSQDKSPSRASQCSHDPPIKLFLKLRYPPTSFAPSSASNSGTSFSTASKPTITTPRALACLTINSLVFAATLLSKSSTSAASQAAKFLIDQAQQFGDIGNSLQQAYDASSGNSNGETFPDSLGNLFEAVFFSMSMLRHELSDSVEGVKVAIQYEDTFQRLSERDEDEGDEFVPTGFGFTKSADMSGSLSDDWPYQDDSISFSININSWRRLALLSIATFQFSAAIAHKLGAVEDALFLAQQAACLENMGESACRCTSVAGETLFRSAERAKPYVFSILTGLWEEYKNNEDDIASVLDEVVGYFGIYEELKNRLGASGEPENSGESVSGEENEEEPDDIFMELERIDLPDGDTTQEIVDEFSGHEVEELDDIMIPGMGVTDLDEETQSNSEDDPNAMHMEQVDCVVLSEKPMVHGIANIMEEQLHAVPRENLGDIELSKIGSTELGQETKAEVNEMPLKNMLMMIEADMTFPATGSANKVEDSDSELSEMSIKEFNTLVFMESNKRMTAIANENSSSAANNNVPISRTREGGGKKFLEHPSGAVEKGRPFECDECDNTYPCGDALKRHKTNIHGTGDKPYSCADCDKKFWGRHQLQEHDIVHSKDYLKCDDCDKIFSRQGELNKHVRQVHLGEKKHECDKCDKKFFESTGLKDHKRSFHAGERPYKCGECGKAFATSSSCAAHQRDVHGGEKFICDECGKSFSYKSTLKDHKRAIHAGENSHECQECDESFARKSTLDQHYRNFHTNEKSFECKECEEKFRTLDNLKVHQRTAVHAPFNCEDCDKKFERDNELAKHQQGHCKPKLFLCSDCESKFARKDGLLRHRRTIHGADADDVVQKGGNKAKNKEFHCRECGKGYSRSDSLSRHEQRFHWEDVNGKPFQCDSCGKRFARRDQLVKHEVYCNGSDVSESEMDEDEMEDEENIDAIVKAVSGPPFYCACGKSYASLYSLSRHRRTCNGLVNEGPETGDGEEMDVDADGETDIEVDIEVGEINDGSELSDTK